MTYRIGEDGCTYQSSGRKIMDGWIVITQILRDYKTGEVTYVLYGKDKTGREINLKVPAERFFDHRKLRVDIESRFDVKCETRFHKEDKLYNIIKDLTSRDELTEFTEVDQVIWLDDKLIIPGLEPQGYKCNIDKKIFPYNMSEELDIWDGLKALEHIIKSVGIHNIMPLIILIFISPVVGKLFPDDRYGYALVGETGTLKTAICRLLFQIYGNGFESKDTMIKLGEGSTGNAAKKIAAAAGCMPILLDNFKPYKTWSISDLASLIHSLMEGSDKARLTKDSKLREDSLSFYCLPLITGEDYAVDAATGARIMKLNWAKPDIPILDLATPEMRKHLPAIGRLWLEWLMSEDGLKAMEWMKEEFPKRRAEVMKEFKDIEAVNPDRLATNVTLERLGFELMTSHPVIGNYFAKFSDEFKAGYGKGIRDIGEATAEGSEVNVILEMLKEGIATETLILGGEAGYGKTVIGWKKDNQVFIYPNVLEEYSARHLQGSQKLSKAAIGRMLVSHKLIEPDKEGKSTQVKKLPGTQKTARVYVFKKETLINEIDWRQSSASQLEAGATA